MTDRLDQLQQAFKNKVELDDLVDKIQNRKTRVRVETTPSGAEVEHGKYGTYTNNGCRCEPCTVSARIYHRERRERLSDELGVNSRVARNLGITGAEARPQPEPTNKQGCKWCYDVCWYCAEYSAGEHRNRQKFIGMKREKDGEFCQNLGK